MPNTQDKKLRLILVLLLFATLGITVPLFMLRASGYRFDSSKLRFVSTGSIAVTSVPIGSTVTIDGDRTASKNTSIFSTTAYFPNLLPGTYRATASADGRDSWTKTVEVEEKQTTSFAFVRLFPSEPTIAWELARKPQKLLLDPNEKLLIAWDDEGLFVHDLKDGAISSSVSRALVGDVERATWLGDNRLLVSFAGGAIVILDNVRNGKQSISPLAVNIKSAEPFGSKGLLLHTVKDSLILIELSERNPIPLPISGKAIAENMPFLATHGSAISFLDTRGTLWTLDGNLDKPKQRSIIGLNIDTITSLIASSRGNAFLALDESGGAWLLGDGDERFELIAEGIMDAQFSFDERKAILIGTRQLTLYALKDRLEQPIRLKGAREIVTRFSEPIISAELLTPEEEYIIVLTKGSTLSLIELDPRGGRNTWTLNDIASYATQTNPPMLYVARNNASLSIIPIPLPGLLTQLLL